MIIETLVDLIGVMMKLNNYAKNLGKRNIIIYVFIYLGTGINADIVFVLKAKTHTLKVYLKQIHSSFCNLMISQIFLCFFFRDNKKKEKSNKN